tara:strand:+ start:1106 stop:1456 length:351 start_codon:yes stop_codon:yes gene_type:complete
MTRINDGAGNVMSNLDDLAKWERALSSKSIITDSIKAKAFKSYVHVRGPLYYGYGWLMRIDNSKSIFVGHDGKWVGFRTFVIRHFDSKTCIVILANDGGKTKISEASKIRELFSQD